MVSSEIDLIVVSSRRCKDDSIALEALNNIEASNPTDDELDCCC